MSHVDTQYEKLLKRILRRGECKQNRTNVDTIDLFGAQLNFDLEFGLPLVTTKKVFTRGVIAELLWLVSGETNIAPLVAQGVHIWSEWPFVRYLRATDKPIPKEDSDEWKAQLREFEQLVLTDDAFRSQYGDLGPVYGAQWRHWQTPDGEVDQLARAIELIKTDPGSRRNIVSAWNVADLPRMALAPCHAFFQFDVTGGRLNLQLYQRSADMFLGVPFNLLSYSLLTHMVAQQTGLRPGRFVWTAGSAHIYVNHLDQVREQLSREVRPFPTLELTPAPSIDEYTPEHFKIVSYNPHPAIHGEVAV